MQRSIILTGPMGSGKSSVAQLVAAQLGFELADLDAMIVEQAGMSINRLFAEQGEQFFRDLEASVLASLQGRQGMVLATGGGVVIRPENRVMLHRLGCVVNLNASVTELTRRLAEADDRPLLKGEEPLESRISRIMAERELFYADADIRIDTTDKTLEDVADLILAFYKNAQEAL